MFKIATWNVNSLKVRLPQVLDWLAAMQPDMLALQETKVQDQDFPAGEIQAAGYQATFAGQKTYNGVAILGKTKQGLLATSLPDYEDEQRRVLAVTTMGVTVLNLYVPNGAEVGSEKYSYKLEWFSMLHLFVRQLLKDNPKVIMLGDFNIAPEDRDVYDPKKWEGNVLVSAAERLEFKRLLDAGFSDCYRLFPQEKNTFSWWDYRAAAFRRNHGLRIDHILASKTLSALCQACYIDKGPRNLERPSDHTPVVAEFDI